MKKYDTILCDQDGVLASFTQGVLDVFNPIYGTNYTCDSVSESSVGWGLEKLWDLNDVQMWKEIDKHREFWLNLPMIPWARELYERLKQHANEVVILTSPPKNPICGAHKRLWLSGNLGIESDNVMVGKKKYLLSTPGTLLVDDAPHNYTEFTEKGKGGDCALVPSDWNTVNLSFDQVWDAISEKL